MQSNRIVLNIVGQHIDDASFLWAIRDAAVSDPHYDLNDLVELDINLSAHIRALHCSDDASWEQLTSAIDQPDRLDHGATFLLASLSLKDTNAPRFSETLALSTDTPERVREWISALAWTNEGQLRLGSSAMLRAGIDVAMQITAGGHGALRVAGGPEISAVLDSPLPEARARALKAMGETKNRELKAQLNQGLHSDNEPCRFWAAWSSALLGDKNIGETLKSFVDFDTQFAYRAIQLAPRVLDADNCRSWMSGLAQEESSRRYALIGCGVTGDPVYVPTLISQMAVPEYARVAGEAFSMITGIDLAHDDLDMDQPRDFDAGPTENPADDDVDLDPDENLPWPNPELIQTWWNDHGRAYQVGTRYLCSQPISDVNCRRVLREGFQRQRIAASYELALMNPDEPLFEWRAPGWRQQEWLGLRKPRAHRPANA